jgi:hypothetical protein
MLLKDQIDANIKLQGAFCKLFEDRGNDVLYNKVNDRLGKYIRLQTKRISSCLDTTQFNETCKRWKMDDCCIDKDTSDATVVSCIERCIDEVFRESETSSETSSEESSVQGRLS